MFNVPGFVINMNITNFAAIKTSVNHKQENKMEAKKSIEALQLFATGLTEGALVHKLQGQIFKS